MSGLAALLAGHTKPEVYLWHNAAHVEDVAHAVEKARWRFVYLDGWTMEDKDTFLKAAGAALDLPDDGTGFEAFSAGLAAVTAGEQRGTVFLWDGWSPLCRADEQSFQQALETFRGRTNGDGDKLAVLLRGDGPSIDVPELPDGPH